MTHIWLNADQWNHAYLYDTERGHHKQFVARSPVLTAAGNGG